MGQFKTYPEDAPGVDTECAATVWVAFARYDAWCDEYSDSGRTMYATKSQEDAQNVFDTWCNGGFNPDVEFSVRRGGVFALPSVDDPEFKRLVYAADDHGWSDELAEEFE